MKTPAAILLSTLLAASSFSVIASQDEGHTMHGGEGPHFNMPSEIEVITGPAHQDMMTQKDYEMSMGERSLIRQPWNAAPTGYQGPQSWSSQEDHMNYEMNVEESGNIWQ